MAKKKAVSKVVKKSEPVEADKVTMVALSDLHLDKLNPRLGGFAASSSKEASVLDRIVEEFGVDDVLSSISVNGYFSAEPIIGLKNKNAKDGITVKEGNRRLAACLILAGDPRAKNQEKRTKQYGEVFKQMHPEGIKEIPVIIYHHDDDARKLLSYLGVRHISGSQPWDSYAKAAWIAKVLESGDLSLDDVSNMIGDQHRTVARLLEGHYFVRQLIDSGRFNPKDSLRRGRGSNAEFPFSWVYTTLGYKPVREWLEMKDMSENQTSKPIKKEKLDDASDLMTFIFGNKSKSKQAVITDSREIADLAIALGDSSRREMLRRGKTVREVVDLSRSAVDRVTAGLVDAQESLLKALAPLAQGEVNDRQSQNLIEPSKKVRKLASDVAEKIFTIAMGSKDPSGE